MVPTCISSIKHGTSLAKVLQTILRFFIQSRFVPSHSYISRHCIVIVLICKVIVLFRKVIVVSKMSGIQASRYFRPIRFASKWVCQSVLRRTLNQGHSLKLQNFILNGC